MTPTRLILALALTVLAYTTTASPAEACSPTMRSCTINLDETRIDVPPALSCLTAEPADTNTCTQGGLMTVSLFNTCSQALTFPQEMLYQQCTNVACATEEDGSMVLETGGSAAVGLPSYTWDTHQSFNITAVDGDEAHTLEASVALTWSSSRGGGCPMPMYGCQQTPIQMPGMLLLMSWGWLWLFRIRKRNTVR